MPNRSDGKGLEIIEDDFDAVVNDWIEMQKDEGIQRTDLFSETEIHEQTRSFLRAFIHGIRAGGSVTDFSLEHKSWQELRDVLDDITRERIGRGVPAGEMAGFVLALKEPVFNRLREHYGKKVDTMLDEIVKFGSVVDELALFTNQQFIIEREQVIERQRDEMLELSTPVVELWERVLTIPLIGTLDSVRAQEVMENLLEAIVRHRAEVAIVDITGVQTVDTQVAQHLLRTAAAVRLMGAECIISGVSPKIAQTIVQLGVDVGDVTTRSSIRTALVHAFETVGYTITRRGGEAEQFV
ncbi:STAS domain-containing protein [Oricola cellulosilytica]|uniref:STAS domain-containing protein n=1 Tax=Oricola cellulosilytica TaxID=1429082 RepID=A0A4R0PGY8_9HYPH|nr:STAS domain-containing protein [Oricola cellulosilytica]TCD16143.1 STAS domain-containing protein [Oricola cellulosilytica]